MNKNNLSNNFEALDAIRLFALILLIPLGFYNFIAYSGNWGGDPEIHIVFARNFLAGSFLEFNPGEITSGETSPIYMLIVAFFALLLEPGLVPFAMKSLSISALFLGIWLIVQQAKDKWDKMIFASTIMAIPSISFQAWLGMENLLFSVLFVWVFFSIIYTGLILSSKTGIQKHYKYCFIATVLFFLRPEAIFLLLAGFFVSFLRREFKSTVIYLIVMILLLISLEVIDIALGSPLHGAGRLRAIVSSHNAYELLFWGLEINFNPKALYYFIAISPFFACLTFCLFFDKAKCKRKVKVLTVSCLTLSAPLILHFLNIFPNTHFSRYHLYFFFSSIIIVIWVYDNSKLEKNLKAFIQVFILLLSISIFYWENSSRDIWLNRILNSTNAKAIYDSQTYETQKDFSQELCEASGQCDKLKLPIAVALQEVQIRLRLNENYLVYSLDGIVDHKLENFIDNKDCIDHFEYLRFRQIKILLDFVEYLPTGSNCGITLREIKDNIEKNGNFEHRNIRFHSFVWRGSTRAWLEHI